METFKPEIIYLNPEKLTPYVNNTKKHDAKQLDRLAGAIAKFGFTQPILVDKDHVIIAGHGRREAAQKLGLPEVPVIVIDHLDEYQVQALRIADNKLNESDWDEEILKFELGTLSRQEFDLMSLGFDEKELKTLMKEAEQTASENQNQTPPNVQTQLLVAIECDDEVHQQELYEELTERGLKCKIIT